MRKFKNSKEAFASQNFDPSKVEISGVPEQHVEAVKAIINLFVVHDAVNPTFTPDFTDSNWKYSNYFELGSPSGRGFSFNDDDGWYSVSFVGSRLVSENSEASNLIAKICKNDYKNLMVYDRSKFKIPGDEKN